MNFWPPATQFIYSDSPIPKLTAQPNIVYSTPGLGHFVQDYVLYVPLYQTYVSDVKEVEKKLPEGNNGGYELNPPLTGTLRSKRKKKKGRQKGQGSSETDAIETALRHPIKVYVSISLYVLLL